MQQSKLTAYQLGIIGQFHHADLPPVVIMGRSGIGKTAFTRAISKALNKKLFGFEMSGKRAEDISGYGVPDHETGTMRFYPDSYVRSILELPEGACIVFFDEIADLAPSVQIAMHPVLCGKTFGIEKLHPKTAVCGAGNPPEVSTTGGSLAPAVVRRVGQIFADVDANEWASGNEIGFSQIPTLEIESTWTNNIPTEQAMVSAYIRVNPEALDQDADESHLPAPCPRQWTNVGLYNALCKGTGHLDARLHLISGCIGEQQALKYIQWEKQQDIPDWREVLAGTIHHTNWPTRGDQIHILAKSCVAGTLSEFNPKNVQACWNMLAQLHRMGHGDFAALACGPLANAGFPRGWNGQIPKEIEEFSGVLESAGLL